MDEYSAYVLMTIVLAAASFLVGLMTGRLHNNSYTIGFEHGFRIGLDTEENWPDDDDDSSDELIPKPSLN